MDGGPPQKTEVRGRAPERLSKDQHDSGCLYAFGKYNMRRLGCTKHGCMEIKRLQQKTILRAAKMGFDRHGNTALKGDDGNPC
jgi:hypothetical protein